MWELVLATFVIVVITVMCFAVIKRRFAPSLFLGIAAGIVTLVLVQPANSIEITSNMQIGTMTVGVILFAIEVALGCYISLMYPTQQQTTIEKMPPTPQPVLASDAAPPRLVG